ncbi:MAG: 16S rRNA (cytidine(1402)-2'-O)-methyltransferase [Rhodospirillaceae bacterium]|nr:16S rRNA (cytidine(1402)-2'-O)-methyltransferase [Rhodospirillaceae bacterium]MBT5081368.1 16S rRNA (cytidine(1402)-2'-O)-methyltransferase [Rhodospirillaceae bacterium]MBT5522852.1 16S rRNA (cytidine(1402)-2'-O)-methyltransferase [Rhodospirillaceae bacterium]MBT5880913.1 16S rRNA (cytidine(1402)-2'-O)-methyltransferase [Rhodospirillaceae bacterium]MBT6591056.1 16S rRNA (cytidine(1402)-2'-O)-methyltransferase [Rhodospirillaceae bacterium]
MSPSNQNLNPNHVDQSNVAARGGKATETTAETTAETTTVTTTATTKVTKFEPGLYIVATPIGNARDITLRALDLLAAADVIACEDTRVTRKLLLIHGITCPTVAYHDHNAARMRPRLMERLINGEIVALVSDAGTPLISDPGYKLVKAAREGDVAVTALPGASAPMAALASAGLPTDRFLFTGFLPGKTVARRRTLAELASLSATLVFFEAAPRLAASLADMAAELGPREAAVMRELTKKFEEARHGSLEELAGHYAEAGPPKGEIVILVAPPGDETVPMEAGDIDALLVLELERGSVKDAARAVAEQTGLPRRDLYNRAVALRADEKGA